MKVRMSNAVVGVGAGIIDEVVENADAGAGRLTPFKNWTDWSRVGLAVIGYGGQMMNMFTGIAEPLAQSEITLVTKSVGGFIRSKMSTGTTSVKVTRVAHQADSGKMAWRPKPVGTN